MITQVRIELPESSPQKEKGDFLEDLLRAVMERQRYHVQQRLNFTGTEIDLLCSHKDRKDDTALVECKARQSILADDVKNFAFDLVVSKKAKHGYFVHTSELQHNAGGLVSDLSSTHGEMMTFIGPEKLMELLAEAGTIVRAKPTSRPGLNITKTVLLFTPETKAWVYIYADGVSPSHFAVLSATSAPVGVKQTEDVRAYLQAEVQDLELITSDVPVVSPSPREQETIAEVQESQDWTDLRPVGSRYFVGRQSLTQDLYRFVRAPLENVDAPRVFFIEGKSGWGKSSLVAHLRARSTNRRNRNTFFVLAVDSRSANTSAFVGTAISRLLTRAVASKFLPQALTSTVRIASWMDVLADAAFDDLFGWLRKNDRVLVLVFDQFEDVFRKHDLFRAFHKLMIDVAQRRENLVIGFSWKSEINIPMDNPAYGLWQQAREHSQSFQIERFGAAEVENVIAQLQQQSGQTILLPLRRRLREGSQGFPWLIKKLATHCYSELQKGLTADDLVDQDLNVKDLFDRDRESLNPDEARALKVIAQRGYDGDPFDVSEVDDRISGEVVDRLVAKRLVVRTGGKYNVYWDIFRDYLVEERPPKLEESFLLRQYPAPCVEALQVVLAEQRAGISEIQRTLGVSEGTALNLIRELRNVGVLSKREDHLILRSEIQSVDSFKDFMKNRLMNHIVLRFLRRPGEVQITKGDLIQAMRSAYSSFVFEEKTWEAYADYMVAWLQFCEINLGGRLAALPAHREATPASYTPQCRPERLLEFLRGLPLDSEGVPRVGNKRGHSDQKPIYDLKVMGFLVTSRESIYLTKAGRAIRSSDPDLQAGLIAGLAGRMPKIGRAARAFADAESGAVANFDAGIEDLLASIASPSYRALTRNVLRAWGKFIAKHGLGAAPLNKALQPGGSAARS